MAPEILIVGDEARRATLVERVMELGYAVADCGLEQVRTRVADNPAPTAIMVCAGTHDAARVMGELRESGHGSAIPVTVCGELGAEVRDLAEVLELGADHFLEEPVADDQLAAVLATVAGPPQKSKSVQPSAGGEEDDGEGPWPSRTEVLSDPDAAVAAGATASVRRPGTGSDPVIGQLHRTLDLLEERLRAQGRDGVAQEGADDELERSLLELNPVPMATEGEAIDPADSQDGLEVARVRAGSVEPERGTSNVDATILLEAGSAGTRPRTTAPAQGTAEHDVRPRPLDFDEVHEPASARVLRDRPRRTMPLPVDQEGTVETIEVPRLLWKLHRARFTGAVTLIRSRVEKKIWLQTGVIMFAGSNLGHDRLIDGLFRRGLLTREQYDAGRRLAAKEPRRAGQLIVEAGFVKPEELPRVLRAHLCRIVDSTFPWVEGTWRLGPGEHCDETVALDTPTPVVLMQGIRDRMDAAQLWALLGGPRQYPILRSPIRPDVVARLAEDLRMSPSEEVFVHRFDGRHSLEALSTDATVDELELLALVYGLHVMDIVDLVGEKQPIPTVQRGRDEVDRERIEARLKIARDGDYFELLGLDRGAGRVDVRRARAALLSTFGEHIESETKDAMKAELAELCKAIEEAARILSDDALRNAYLAHLEEP